MIRFPSALGAACIAFGLSCASAQSLPVTPQVAIGAFHACALASTGGVRCWGDNSLRQLGDGSSAPNRTAPRDVLGLSSGVAAIAAGYRHTCALLVTGGVRCWGENASGQLGDGTFTNRDAPVDVAGLSANVRAITTRNNHTCALLASGGVRCWGENFFGQLGAGDGSFPSNRDTPRDVPGFTSGVRAVAAGGHHTCALKNDGTLWCWGQNFARQLGTATTTRPTDQPQPVAVAGATQLALGWEHSCALTGAGGVKCWGLNDNGQVGLGPLGTPTTGPVDVAGLASGVASVAAGYYHTCAISQAGAMLCWGNNSQHAQGMLGDGTTSDRFVPRVATFLGSRMVQAAAGWGNTGGLADDGTVVGWGGNLRGTVGDGTYTDRFTPQLVVAPDGRGFLDLTPENPQSLAALLQQAFTVLTSSASEGSAITASSTVFARPEDAGQQGNLYVFALAPRESVIGASLPEAGLPGVKTELPLPCVLAQLTGSGQLAAVPSDRLQAYISGTLSEKGTTVDVLRAVNSANVAGATFFVGYGSSPSQMFDGGTNRGVVSVPGARECRPQPPQSGWWWNPAEGGRGFSIEVSGNRVWIGAFLYDASGRATWHVFGGRTALDGAVFTGRLYGAAGGQSLGGDYRRPVVSDAGAVTIAFANATTGTLVWPGGSVPIQRFDIVPGGLAAATPAVQPESGWWWNPAEDGRGFFIEWQNGWADLAGYMYDAAGNPVWYLSVVPTPDLRRLQGSWWEYANGQTLTGAYRPPQRISDNVAPVTIDFTSATEAVMTLPGGRTTRLVRYRF